MFFDRKQRIQTKVFVDTSTLNSSESSILFCFGHHVIKMTVITNKGVIGDDQRVLLILLDNYNDFGRYFHQNQRTVIETIFSTTFVETRDTLRQLLSNVNPDTSRLV